MWLRDEEKETLFYRINLCFTIYLIESFLVPLFVCCPLLDFLSLDFLPAACPFVKGVLAACGYWLLSWLNCTLDNFGTTWKDEKLSIVPLESLTSLPISTNRRKECPRRAIVDQRPWRLPAAAAGPESAARKWRSKWNARSGPIYATARRRWRWLLLVYGQQQDAGQSAQGDGGQWRGTEGGND